MRKLRIAIIGYGGIARMHNSAYARLALEGFPCELVAVCDRDASRITAKMDFNLGANDMPLPDTTRIYTDIDELIANEDFDVADICLPTKLHKDISIKMLRAGKHTVCEKPMALSYEGCLEMVECSKECKKELMIAQVLRFDKAYKYLREIAREGSLGALRSIHMDRHSIYPGWGGSFADNSVTGGCTLDTHIHDVDVARYIFGEPTSVYATVDDHTPNYQAVTTHLNFKAGSAVINCSWDSAYEFAFSFGYRARFEGGTVVCDNGTVKIKPNCGEIKQVDLGNSDGVCEELRFFLSVVSGNIKNLDNPPESSAESVRIIEKILESSAKGQPVLL